jgi:MFS family permease
MAIPLGFLSERYGRRLILWVNLVPRISMLVWAVVVGYFDQLFSTKAFLAAPFLSVLGGDCVFNSLTYSMAAGLTEDRVQR